MTFEIDGFTPAGILGRGGFGTVHRAADDVHGREVAVKILGRIDDDSARRRFDRERRAMGTLSGHPNIGVVYTSGFTSNHEPYIVMEMIRGGSLADRLEREGPLPAADVIELGVTVADALHHAHQAGVLHLDLKPENILMSQFGRPKIVDFGIAALIDDQSATATIRATPSYADPEVLDGRSGTERSDVYGLAATMYTLLTGSPPYSDGPSGLYQVMRRVAFDPVPRVERADVSPRLAEVLHRAMAKEPDDRPASMAEFAEELRGVTTEPITQRLPHAPVSDPTPVPDPTSAPDPTPVPPHDPNRGLPITPPPSPAVAPRPVPPAAPTPASGVARPALQPRPPSPARPAERSPGQHAQPAARPIAGGRVRRPRTALVATLSAVAVVLAIVLVVVVVQRQDGSTTATVPGRTVPGATSGSAVPTTRDVVPDGIVPSVIGLTEADARESLEAEGYLVRVPPHCFDRVSGQDPASGTPLDDGSFLELTFDPCVVPDFVGLSLPTARSIVEDDFVVGLLISWPEHCDDLVLGQSIAPGVTVEPGTEVALELRTDCS